MDRSYGAYIDYFVLLSILLTFSTVANAQNYTLSNSTTTDDSVLKVLTTAEPDDGNSTTGVPEPGSEPGVDIMAWIRENPEYLAMIGMGVLIVLLVVVAVAIVCHLTSRRNEREAAYHDKA